MTKTIFSALKANKLLKNLYCLNLAVQVYLLLKFENILPLIIHFLFFFLYRICIKTTNCTIHCKIYNHPCYPNCENDRILLSSRIPHFQLELLYLDIPLLELFLWPRHRWRRRRISWSQGYI